MARHHYVPQFLLGHWAIGGRLNYGHWNDGAGRVVTGKTAVRAACQIEDLNAFYGLSGPERDAPEKEFFSPQIDTPASEALAVILNKNVQALTPAQRSAWARFIVTFGLRTPETLRGMGPAEFRRSMEIVRGTAQGPPELEATATGLIAKDIPRLERNVPLTIAMDLGSDPGKLRAVASMYWWRRRFDRKIILIGDRPLLANVRMPYPCGIPLNDPNCLIALPISSDTVFFASKSPHTRAKMRRMPINKLAYIVNKETVCCAREFVYFLDRKIANFVEQRLTAKARTNQPKA